MSASEAMASESDASASDVDMELAELLALADSSDAWSDWLAQSSGMEPLKLEAETKVLAAMPRSESPRSVEAELHEYTSDIVLEKRLDRRRRQNRESMARLRRQQKESVESLTAQQAALQRILHQMLAHNKPIHINGEASTPQKTFKVKMTELLRTREALAMEKQQLTDQLVDRRQRGLVARRLIELTLETRHCPEADVKGNSTDDSDCTIKTEASYDPHVDVRAAIVFDQEEQPTTGYWLQFLEHESPLYYEPLTPDLCASIIYHSLVTLERIRQALQTPEAVMLSTQCLGWKLERTREASPVNGKPLLRMRCVKRIPRSMASIQELQGRTWDFLCTPESITRVNHGSVTAMIAQQIGEDSVVLLRNSPDKTNHKLFRYFSLNTRLRISDSEAAVVLMIITDKEAWPRETRGDGLSIKWLKQGCSCLRFSVMDAATVQLEYTGAIECASEEHATNLIVANCSALLKWEHLVVPPQLLGW